MGRRVTWAGESTQSLGDLYTDYSSGSIALGSLAVYLPGTARWSPGGGDLVAQARAVSHQPEEALTCINEL